MIKELKTKLGPRLKKMTSEALLVEMIDTVKKEAVRQNGSPDWVASVTPAGTGYEAARTTCMF